jgi:hypothetical protein
MRKSALKIGGGRLSYEPSRLYIKTRNNLFGTNAQQKKALQTIRKQIELWSKNRTCPTDNYYIGQVWSDGIHGQVCLDFWKELDPQ